MENVGLSDKFVENRGAVLGTNSSEWVAYFEVLVNTTIPWYMA